MTAEPLTPDELATLAALANGIIPADDIDAGAAAVNAAPRLSEKIQAGINATVYRQGLQIADEIAREKYGRSVVELSPPQIHELLGSIRDRALGFFKQLRMDVSALYLSDPAVWTRIGFPGPSIESGGYPDFDQPQTRKETQLKESPSS